MMEEHRIPLAPGTVLFLGDEPEPCVITGRPVRFGGSALLYEAKREGQPIPLLLKECYPAAARCSFRRSGCRLAGEDPASEQYLEQCRENFSREARISGRVAARSARALPAWECPGRVRAQERGRSCTPLPAHSFLILQNMEGLGLFLPELLAECAAPVREDRPLRTGGLPSLRTTALILVELLRAVELVHRAGYLHGDIQPGNLFFADARLERGEVGFGCLLDFGCAREIDGSGATAPLTKTKLHSTPGYTPPELAVPRRDPLFLDVRADVYSAGRVLLYLLKGRTYAERGWDRMYESYATLGRLTREEAFLLGGTDAACAIVNRLLERSLHPDPDRRYPAAAAMLRDAQALEEETRPVGRRLALGLSALREGDFLERPELFAQISARLAGRRGPAVLCGFPGMGKTELAIEFGCRRTRGKAYFVRFSHSFTETVTGPVARAFSGYSLTQAGRPKGQKQLLREVLGLLAQLGEDDLIIIDNVDSDTEDFAALCGDPAYEALCALPQRLILTTREEVEGGIPVGPLEKRQLRELLGRFVSLPEETADSLIDAVEGHTLTVELMGRCLKRTCPPLSPEELLAAFRSGDLGGAGTAAVSIQKDRRTPKARIEDHLSKLLRLSALPKEELHLLCCALLAPEEGMDLELFCRFPAFDRDVWNRLLERGLVRLSSGGLLTIHPLIRSLGWQQGRTAEIWEGVPLGYRARFAVENREELSSALAAMIRETHPEDGARCCAQMCGLCGQMFQSLPASLREAEKKTGALRQALVFQGELASLACFFAGLAAMGRETAEKWAMEAVLCFEAGEAEPLLLGESLICLGTELGSFCETQAQFLRAMECYARAAPLVGGHSRCRAAVCHGLGGLAIQTGEYETALRFEGEALASLKRASPGEESVRFCHIPLPSEIWLKIAECRLWMKQCGEAFRAAKEALNAPDTREMPPRQRDAQEMLQRICAAQADWEGVLCWGEKALRTGALPYEGFQGGTYRLSSSFQFLPLSLCADACARLKRWEEGLRYLHRALDCLQGLGEEWEEAREMTRQKIAALKREAGSL